MEPCSPPLYPFAAAAASFLCHHLSHLGAELSTRVDHGRRLPAARLSPLRVGLGGGASRARARSAEERVRPRSLSGLRGEGARRYGGVHCERIEQRDRPDF
ncbi:hypothetical protein B296_00058023 [Ensete ventricosum]|uniref:Uncharacterized protein n=1 Tax=Ensete ventricosum TaxID=4639 RepID=A0A426X6J2_ENSVE|nr:hypothetical protein B296_00058023 [Ensete ventricosum]